LPIVFTINGKPFTTDNLYQYSKHRLKALGLNNYTQYGLRHGLGFRLAKAGVSAFYIAYLLGHKDLKTTDRYIEKENNHLIQILNNVN
jgi:integrase